MAVILPNEPNLPLCLQQISNGKPIPSSRPLRPPIPRPHRGMIGAPAVTRPAPAIEPASAMRPRNVCAAREIFHFLFFCYCLRAKKGYSMGDCAPTTGGVYNV
jgi:hypothetical protein